MKSTREFISETLSYLMIISPFDAATLYQLKFVENSSIDTYCGVSLYEFIYNPQFFEDNPLTTKEFAFVLKHEARHILFDHIPREVFIKALAKSVFGSKGITDSYIIDNEALALWNVATDISINDILLREDKVNTESRKEWLFSSTYSYVYGEQAEFYYQKLLGESAEHFKKKKEEDDKQKAIEESDRM